MMRVFLDESSSTKVFQMAAWIGRAEEWGRFINAWQEALASEPTIKYFKNHETLSFEGQFTAWC